MKNIFKIYLIINLIVFLFSAVAISQPLNLNNSKGQKDYKIMALANVNLVFIDPGADPFSGYRWQDVAGNVYSDTYRNNYVYSDTGVVHVQVTFEQNDVTFKGQLLAIGLKPNFAYQIKLNGFSGTASNELIGLAGRWWQEEWDGSQWTNGQNLNDKGDGSSPNPNDLLYFDRRDDPDPTSPTGLNYRYTGYLVFDYFITDEEGNALVNFEANSSYHVLWNTIQLSPTINDGPEKSVTFDPDPDQTAYDTDYAASTMTIFGEWERLPVGGIYLAPGDYQCEIILTEESFHGWPGGLYTGQWAAAMGTTIQFTIAEDDPLAVQLSAFRAESGNSSVRLKWNTESELNHAGFEIFRSSQPEDGYVLLSDYRSNPDLIGQGNSSLKHEYIYIDRDVRVGKSYWYSLVGVDFSGQRTSYGPLQVTLTKKYGLNQRSSASPEALHLYPNFPNPFNSLTIIRFDIPGMNQLQQTISLAIYNSSGQKIRSLYQGEVAPGTFEIEWDGQSDTGRQVASGIYYMILSSQNHFEAVKMMLLK